MRVTVRSFQLFNDVLPELVVVADEPGDGIPDYEEQLGLVVGEVESPGHARAVEVSRRLLQSNLTLLYSRHLLDVPVHSSLEPQ